MAMELMATEAAAAAGVSASTFRSYVARGQAPPPRRKVGGVNVWSLLDLVGWRNLEMPDKMVHSATASISMTYSRAREWQNSTRRWLAQLGLSQAQAQRLLDGTVPAGLDTQGFRDASAVIDTRKRLRSQLATAEPIFDRATDHELVERAAQSVAEDSEVVFEALADLALAMTSRGLPEVLLPPTFDESFWSSQDDDQSFAQYLLGLPRVDLPRLTT